MLSTLQSVLKKASREHYAVGAFNISNLEQIQAVIWAAEEGRSPVIVNVTAKAIEYGGLEVISSIVQIMAKKATVPVVLNLDHGRNVGLAKECIDVGFSGIMFDGSTLPYAKNVQRTAEVVRAGQKLNVGVEGELGRVKYPSDMKKDPQVIKTDPDQAVDFVQRTGICAFAVAIGNSHGLPVPHEHLDFALLDTLHRRLKVPLVLHGASGTPPKAIRKAISLGIAKINIDTDLRLAFTKGLRAFLASKPDAWDPREELAPARQAVQDAVLAHMKMFGSMKQA